VTTAVRAATADDVDSIVEVAVRAWEDGFRGIVPPEIDARQAWGRERVRARLREEGRETRHAVAELEGRVRGYIVFGPSRDGDAPARVGEIWALYVHPNAWRRGLGRALVDHALGELGRSGFRAATLWTLAESPAARRFYEACGFALDGASQRRESFGNPLEIRYLRRIF
jgi:ribosomal protein S18 acetylase RimI-like enzyme